MLHKEIATIKNFDYPIACTGLKLSRNKKKLLSIGVYKPSVKLYDFSSMSMKFERHMITDPLKVCPLTDDAEKFCVLRNDKSIEFHSKNGLYDVIKTQCQGKDILYNSYTAELYISGNYNEIYRFNLEQGRFLKGFEGISAIEMALSEKHGLLGTVNKSSIVFYDPRTKSEVLGKAMQEEPSLIALNDNGIIYSVATLDNNIFEYDIRSENPIQIKKIDRNIKQLQYANKSLLCASSNFIQIFNDASQDKIDTGFEVNSFDVDGAIIFSGGEDVQMKTYYVPDLGEVPSWCSSIAFQ